MEVGRIASAYNLAEVDKYVNNFILKNFPALLGSGEFVKLPVERLAFALASNGLRRCSELELFKAACRWLRWVVAPPTCVAYSFISVVFLHF